MNHCRTQRSVVRIFCSAIAASVALSVCADTATVNGIPFTYFVSGGKATIGDGKVAAIPASTKGALSIPAKLGGHPVTAIAPYAFYECRITSATIPEGVVSVGEWAFRECTALKSVSLPSTVSTIQGQVFGNTGLTSVVLPSGVKTIRSEAFDHLESLTSVTFPASLKELEEWAFMDCYALSDLTFLGNAPTVGSESFYYCPVDKITVHVPKGSTGWGVSIPGTWKGMKIVYSTSSTSSMSSTTPASSTSSTSSATASSSYKVKFNANGGKGKMAVESFVRDKAKTLFANKFSRSDYVFLGWASSKARAKKGLVAYKNKQKVKNLAAASKTTTLYAIWAKKTYKVAFYANGGKGKMVTLKMTYGKAKKLSANKFKAPKGKKFAGWAKSKSAAKKGKVTYKNKQKVKNLVTNGKTVKLYAVWKKKESSSSSSSSSLPSSPDDLSYHVFFDANGGAGQMYAQAFDHDVAQALSANAFSRPGFVFAGWALTSGGVVAYYDRQIVCNLSQGAAVWLYAVWVSDPDNPANLLSFCGQSFLTDSKAPWSATTVDGKSALVSAPIGDNEKSTLYLTLTGPGTLTCRVRTLCQVGSDKLVFDGPYGLVWSGSSLVGDWNEVSCSIPSGTHILTWTYEKDASGSASSDCGWIADVVWSE